MGKPASYMNKKKQNPSGNLIFEAHISMPRFSWNYSGFTMHKNPVENNYVVYDTINALWIYLRIRDLIQAKN